MGAVDEQKRHGRRDENQQAHLSPGGQSLKIVSAEDFAQVVFEPDGGETDEGQKPAEDIKVVQSGG